MNEIVDLLKANTSYLFEEELINKIAEVAIYRKVKAGETVINYGQEIQYMPILLQGAIKVSRLDKEGEELLLYYLEIGDVCAMTLNCCIGNKKSEIRAVADVDTALIMIPVKYMGQWIEKYHSWRSFVFDSYNVRFDELLESIDNLAFRNMHERIQKYLEDKSLIGKSKIIEATHQEIAYDLNTSRVVVSRLLKALEKKGLIKLYRNKIEMMSGFFA